MNQHAHVETLTQGERAAPRMLIEPASMFGIDWNYEIAVPPDVGRSVRLAVLVGDGGTGRGADCLIVSRGWCAIVEGWMSRRFLGGKPTFWTWDARFCRVSEFLPGVMPVVLAGCVEPVAWAERADATSPCEEWASEARNRKSGDL